VERVLAVLDGAVLVVSAVEGVQAQTPLLMRALQRLKVPTLFFINKTDRRGADRERVFAAIAERLTPAAVTMGSADTAELVSVLAENDDTLLADYVNGTRVPQKRLQDELAVQTKRALVHPVFFGSALTGEGVGPLMSGIAELLPAEEGDGDGPLSATVFKVDRGRAGEKVAYVRMFSGTLRTRDRVPGRGEHEQKVTGISVFADGAAVRRASVAAGEIAQLWGLGDSRIGDVIGTPRGNGGHSFPPPTLEAVVVPPDPRDKGALYSALSRLAEQDPLINLRQDDVRGELYVSIYGEVQKEVIQATLANDFCLDADFRETTTICIERPVGTGAAVERLREEPNPFLATVGLLVEPAAPDAGVTFSRAREVLGTMPLAFFKAVEETVQRTLREGIHGWEVTDCTVTMTHSGYLPRQSHAHQGFAKEMSSTGEDFRNLTPLVLMAALRQAGTVVCEPIHRFRLEFPVDVLAALWPAFARLGAVAQTPALQGSVGVMEGEIQAARMHELQLELRSLTRGEGVLELEFDRYEPVRSAVPERPRTDHNPLNRKEYLVRLAQRL
jgi:ribosomal protection tetracycline resistance protein